MDFGPSTNFLTISLTGGAIGFAQDVQSFRLADYARIHYPPFLYSVDSHTTLDAYDLSSEGRRPLRGSTASAMMGARLIIQTVA